MFAGQKFCTLVTLLLTVRYSDNFHARPGEFALDNMGVRSTFLVKSAAQNCRNQVIIFFLLANGSGSVQIIRDLDPRGPKIYGSGSGTLFLTMEKGVDTKFFI
jgi:hypothetical protein